MFDGELSFFVFLLQLYDEEDDDDEDDEADDDDESDTNDDELDTDMIDDRDSPDDVSCTHRQILMHGCLPGFTKIFMTHT